MSWQFRKSFQALPGVRLNISPKGISATVGGGPVRLNFGEQAEPRSGVRDSRPAEPPAQTVLPTGIVDEIRSGGSQTMTSHGLEEFRRLIAEAYAEQQELRRECLLANERRDTTRRRFDSWETGFLFKRLRPKRFAAIRAESESADAISSELNKQLELSTVQTDFDIADDLRTSFSRLCDDFATASSSASIWDKLARQTVDRARERTIADEAISRTLVRFGLGGCELIESQWRVPHLENKNGGDLYIYPGFLLYRVSNAAFAVVDIGDVELSYSVTGFIENGSVPSDAVLMGQTWFKTNKDGLPDRRFANNYQIPILRYGELSFRSRTGLREEFMLSNAVAAEAFAGAWRVFREQLTRGR